MKVLILLTNSYPFGKSEPLVAKQMNLFAKDFDLIHVISSDAGEQILYPLPDHVIIHRISVKLSLLDKIKGIGNIFHSVFKTEKKEIKKKKNFFDFEHHKVALNYLQIGKRYARAIKRLIDKEQLEEEEVFFHSYWCTEGTLGFALLRKEFSHFKMHTRLHAYDLYEERHSPHYLPYRPFIINQLDKLFFISEQGKDYFESKYAAGIKPDQTVLNRLGVGFSETNTLAEWIPSPTLRLVSCSSLIELKRIERIIETLSLIHGISIHWTHYGEGPLMKPLLALAELKLADHSNVQYEFYGFIDNDALIEKYRSETPDLFINTSLYEGIPISMMEALKAGIPCIGTAVGGVSELITEKTGFLLPVDFKNEELLHILEAFASLSEEERKRSRLNCFDTWQTNYNGLSNYRELINEIIPASQTCSRCLYDTMDYPQLSFDQEGVCEICHIYDELQERTVFKNEVGAQKLDQMLSEIKKVGSKKPYDCIIGVSGGVDSSYVAYLSRQWGLRPLIVHVDNGWNSELATKNIEVILKKLKYDLYTHVIDWEDMRDAQLSFLKASVLDIDLPFDNSFIKILYSIAKKQGIKYILSGHNTVTEGWMPPTFTHYKLDKIQIKAILKRFGTKKKNNLPIIGPVGKFLYERISGIQMLNPLDLIEYDKNTVKALLIDELGWRDYGGKHYENVFTKFYQGYILPQKFHVDKRKAHLSTLICSGQLSKETAQKLLEAPIYPMDEVESDKTFFIKKMGISSAQFEEIMEQAPVRHTHYPSYINVIRKLQKVKRFIRRS